MSEIQGEGGFPPRRSRKVEKRKQQVSLKTLIQAGLIVFGALFFGLIGWELYHANQAHKAETRVSQNTSSSTDSQAAQELPQSAQSDSGESADAVEEPVVPLPDRKDAQAEEVPSQTTGETTPSREVAAAVSTQPSASTGPQSATAGEKPTVQPSAPAAQPEAQQADTSQQQPKVVRHIVQKGDTLFKLSRQYYGHNFGVSRIAKYNGLPEDAQLSIGKVVMIPLSS
ncbi:LysM peptidoglycan-binding domain-containing protein [Brevibacillus sp. TJ4]|uniref:LysM peptidoglycan-binding domain-containing protein n=1 Tax=Brevibacillus sp. TJ4 TaxID=3234853 RepID=UPI0037D6D3DD